MRTYHGNYGDYSLARNGSAKCYFNPYLDIKSLPGNDFRYLFRKLAENTYKKHITSAKKKEIISNLSQLAEFMVDIFDNNTDDKTLNSKIPAGYTYFGQFIDHDISAGTDRSNPFQITKAEFDPVNPDEVIAQIKNQRTPTFDLDSVYGAAGAAYLQVPQFYQENDSIKFKIGVNEFAARGLTPNPELDENPKAPERDLPRQNMLPENQREPDAPHTQALIGDVRNDENLIIAQFHLAFLKFHNRLIDDFRANGRFEDDKSLFLAARQEMTFCYQWLVMNDFLPHTIAPKSYDSIMKSRKTLFDVLKGGDSKDSKMYMPLEFSTAAYRFGHSMVRNHYDYNLNFGRGNNPINPRATFDMLFAFTGKGAIDNDRFHNSLPHNWIIQWDRFFEIPEVTDGERLNDRFARKIDTNLSDFITRRGMENETFESLSDLHKDEVEVTEEMFNKVMTHLAKRNLLRGYLLNMPSAQAMIQAVNESGLGPKIKALTPEELTSGSSTDLNRFLESTDFIEETPLWFYILKESEVQEDGNRLGGLGSWIVGHTIVGLIRESKDSYLNQGWNPKDSQIEELKSLNNIMDFLIYAKVAPPRN